MQEMQIHSTQTNGELMLMWAKLLNMKMFQASPGAAARESQVALPGQLPIVCTIEEAYFCVSHTMVGTASSP